MYILGANMYIKVLICTFYVLI